MGEWENSWFAGNPWDAGPKWVRLPSIYTLGLLCLGPQQCAIFLGLADTTQASWVDDWNFIYMLAGLSLPLQKIYWGSNGCPSFLGLNRDQRNLRTLLDMKTRRTLEWHPNYGGVMQHSCDGAYRPALYDDH